MKLDPGTTLAKIIIVTIRARRDLGPDLGGYGGVDLILDQIPEVESFLAATALASYAKAYIEHNTNEVCHCYNCTYARPYLERHDEATWEEIA